MARVEDPQAEDGAVARVGVQQETQRVGDHAVRADRARPHVTRRIWLARASFAEQLVRPLADGAGRYRRRPHEAHGGTLHACPMLPATPLRLRGERVGTTVRRGSDMNGAMAMAA